MTEPETAVHHYVEEFAARADSGPEWLKTVRRSAMDRFSTLGFPSMKNEDWHYTSVAPIASRVFTQTGTGSAGGADVSSYLYGSGPTLVFVDGVFSEELSNTTAAEGLSVTRLADAVAGDAPVLRQHLSRIAAFDAAAFTALNTAMMQDGAVISVAPDTALAEPIQLLFFSAAPIPQSLSTPRNLIVLGHGARASVIESYVGLSDEVYFTNTVTEVVLSPGSRLDHIKIQRESLSAFHVGTLEARQESDSELHSFSFASGGELSRTNIYTVLDGEGSSCTLNGVYMVGGVQHVDHQTRIEHAKPNCTSREVYKGILDDRSHGVFNGKVFVRPEAQKTDGKQSNNNLLLSDHARVDTKPQLEIFADDVKCTHGATVGRLDEVALFYMKSRGIEADHARTLLTYAFAAAVLEEIALEPVRDALEDLVLSRVAKSEAATTARS